MKNINIKLFSLLLLITMIIPLALIGCDDSGQTSKVSSTNETESTREQTTSAAMSTSDSTTETTNEQTTTEQTTETQSTSQQTTEFSYITVPEGFEAQILYKTVDEGLVIYSPPHYKIRFQTLTLRPEYFGKTDWTLDDFAPIKDLICEIHVYNDHIKNVSDPQTGESITVVGTALDIYISDNSPEAMLRVRYFLMRESPYIDSQTLLRLYRNVLINSTQLDAFKNYYW